MKKIKLMNKIAEKGTAFLINNGFTLSENTENPDAILVRSAKLHDMEFNDGLMAIARCGAGVNNIPIEKCTENGVVVFNTPGANANGVKELAVCALILASRDIVDGINWSETLGDEADVAKSVEKGKNAFVGQELLGKTLGVIGLGAIGGMVANAAINLGMNVLGYDPYLTANAAWSLAPSIKQATSFDEIFKASDYITLHVPSTPKTKEMISKDAISKMKDGVRIINLARGDLICTKDLIEGLNQGRIAKYVTDFPSEETLGVKNIINIPHLGASTEESEEHCALMAAKELYDYLTLGNIKNSVNYPDTALPHTTLSRVCVLHKNIPNTLSRITTAFAQNNMNIENLANASKGDNAYTIIETNDNASPALIDTIKGIEGVARVISY